MWSYFVQNKWPNIWHRPTDIFAQWLGRYSLCFFNKLFVWTIAGQTNGSKSTACLVLEMSVYRMPGVHFIIAIEQDGPFTREKCGSGTVSLWHRIISRSMDVLDILKMLQPWSVQFHKYDSLLLRAFLERLYHSAYTQILYFLNMKIHY